jgi:hypothetical protein
MLAGPVADAGAEGNAMDYTLTTTLSLPYDEALDATRAALSEQAALGRVAADARQRITAALAALTQED